ncbi:MAG: 1,4-dihydroxy-2-naphthoate polyprenyltransferase [Cyclobacteriaceae bacterium]|nr:1,4-dihydroxy-2-naphthoate polyprenyltransferase [Cyclobacteriaceae bacterium]
MNVSAWISAFRLRTLPLALSSVTMGGILAASEGKFNGLIFGLCCLTTVLLQILSNLANDYGDSVNGADHAGRTGPGRAVQTGIISAERMRAAIVVFVLLCLGSGISLLWVAFGYDYQLLLTFLGLGLLCIAAAILYTVGRRPYGYAGLGDLSVLIFFGGVGVAGTMFLFTQAVSWTSLWMALAIGLFSVGVLNINNMRDIESDRQAGKYSIPVRLGKTKAGIYHWFLLGGGLVSAVFYTWQTYRSPIQFLFLLSVPLFFLIGKGVNEKPSSELDPYLKRMALSTLLFVVLFGAGQWLAG